MGKPAKNTANTRGVAVINIRTIPSKSNLNAQVKMDHKLSKKSSTTLTSERHTPQAEVRAASLPSESMYRYALRTTQGTTGSKLKSEVSALPVATAVTVQKKQGNPALLWLNVHYAQGDVRKRISFPPGMLVSQARDLCMLRFGVWQVIMKREGAKPDTEPSDAEEAQSMSTQSTASSTNSSREQYGLYWPGQMQWLSPFELMSSYTLVPGDKLELQDHCAFITTAALRRGDGQSAEDKHVEGEGQIYYMQSKTLSAAWKLCWMELSGTLLSCYKRGRLHGSKQRSQRDQALTTIDLSGGFKLVDQHGRQNQRISTSDQLSPSSSAASLLGMSYQHLGGTGSPLIIKCSDGSVHVFCTQSAVDYDYWRRMLRLVQTTHELPTNITQSSASSVTSSRVSHVSHVSRNRAETAATAGSSGSSGSVGSPDAAQIPLRSPNNGTSGVATSLVHRPHHRKAMGHIVARPKCDLRFGDFVKVRTTQTDTSIAPPQRTYLVVVPQTMYGFDGEYTGDTAGMGTTSEFSVSLHNTHVHSAQSEEVFVVSVEREPENGQNGMVFGFEVESREKREQWVEALCAIGGIEEMGETVSVEPVSSACTDILLEPTSTDSPSSMSVHALERDSSSVSDRIIGELDSSGVSVRALGEVDASGVSVQAIDAGLSIRRSRSFVSTLSRADWPLPPTTLPQRMAQTIRPSTTWTRHSVARDSSDPNMGNPSLDAVGMRLDYTQPPQRQQSRFPWFRRNILGPGSGPK
ncbi:hypothetical protein IWW56_004072 [Coemansia sp. RSA 2131]|nr:hypothetical protein IWW56_004072 [Coemansia sp. RSA 2131]